MPSSIEPKAAGLLDGARPTRATQRRRSAGRLRRLLADQQGAALLEFTVVVPMLLAVMFGIAQYGLAMLVYGNMYDAARLGARQLAVSSATEAQAKSAALARLSGLWPTGWNVVAEDIATTGTNEVRVTITVPGSEAGIISFIPMPTQFRAQAVFRKEASE